MSAQNSGRGCLVLAHDSSSLAVQFGFFLKLLVKFFVLLPEVLCLLPHGLRVGPTRFDHPPKHDSEWDQDDKNEHERGKPDCPPEITPFAEALDLAEQDALIVR